jgi:hypothetical protein
MAENVYSKGTRVWFVDKDQAWISAEVTNVTRGADDAVTIVCVDEKGKVCTSDNWCYRSLANTAAAYRKPPSTPR